MNFEQDVSLLFEDFNIPEVFVSEYICAANGDYVKIYLYCCYLCKHKIDISPLDMSKKLNIPISSVEEGLKYWEENGVLLKKGQSYVLANLKQIELNKLYKPKLSISAEEAIENTEKNISMQKKLFLAGGVLLLALAVIITAGCVGTDNSGKPTIEVVEIAAGQQVSSLGMGQIDGMINWQPNIAAATESGIGKVISYSQNLPRSDGKTWEEHTCCVLSPTTSVTTRLSTYGQRQTPV